MRDWAGITLSQSASINLYSNPQQSFMDVVLDQAGICPG